MPDAPRSRTLGVALAIAAFWLVVGVVWGAQNALGASLQGNPTPLAAAVRTALINSLPWIPVTWAVVALTVRYPVTRSTWRRTWWRHVVAFPVVAYGANVFVVLGFWWAFDNWQGPRELLDSAAFWTTLRLHVALVLYVAIAGLTQGVVFYREARRRELSLARLEGQLATARLQALNAQIRPHFLFNTLHTIGQMWRSGRSDEADAMLDRLGALFQRVQATPSHGDIPLDEELDMVRDYLAIEQARFPDRLEPTVEASPEALRCRVPPLLLQPLVENAVRHGVSASSSAGRIRVTARVEGAAGSGDLVVEVADDGPGMEASSPSPGTGTGLANTRARLETVYADAAALEIGVPEGGGTLVRVRLPGRTAPWTPSEAAV